MKEYLFIITHFGAGGNLLSRILNSNIKIDAITDSQITYNHLDSLHLLDDKITENPNLKHFAPIYCDVIKQNEMFSCNEMYKFCKFIFLLRNPEDTLRYNNSYDYYRFRLRKMYLMSRKAKYSICLTYEELINRHAFPVIEDFLNLKEKIKIAYNVMPEDTGDLALGKIEYIKQPDIFVPPIHSQRYNNHLNAIRKNCRD